MNERPTAKAHEVVGRVVRRGDQVVDATVGNGHDTLFLAGRVGDAGRVLGFDIQREAIETARRRLGESRVAAPVELVVGSHARLGEFAAPGSLAAVMFNLGYLPGGDHRVTTEIESTLAALGLVPELLRAGGVLTVVCYPGHPGGAAEAEAVAGWAEELGGAEIGRPARPGAPFLVWWQKG